MSVSPVFIIIYDDVGGRGEVDALEQGCWSEGGGFAVLPRLLRRDAMDLGLKQHGDVLRSPCYNDMCLVVCNMPVHRLTKPCWRWCFFGSSDG
jgi:hypothetical protein